MSKTKRPRLRGARQTYDRFDLTGFINKMHVGSTMLRIQPSTTGAFGGCTKATRRARAVVKQANPPNSPVL